MSITVLFLLALAAFHFSLSLVQSVVLFAGYVGFTALDAWYRRRRTAKLVDDELFGWEVDKEDTEYENRGNLSRRRLTGENQIVAVRVVKTLQRML